VPFPALGWDTAPIFEMLKTQKHPHPFNFWLQSEAATLFDLVGENRDHACDLLDRDDVRVDDSHSKKERGKARAEDGSEN